MNIEQYKQELNRHDWWYDYSDDHKAWKRGQANWERLRELSKESPEHYAALRAKVKEIFDVNV